MTPFPCSQWTVRTFSSSTMWPEPASTFLAAVSHIIPGPYFGYWNSSIRLVTCLARLLRRPITRARKGSHTALQRDMPLMRWAPSFQVVM